MPDKFALISVSNKTGLEDLARALVSANYTLLSTGGTARHIRELGLAVTDVSDVTDFPEIMDGRVKTLHPRIHGGILARRENDGDAATLQEHDIPRIDIVVANLYPFSEVSARTESTHAEVLENIDIGGPAMVRAAAKNYPRVAVVVDPLDYPRIIDEVLDGGVSAETRRELAQKAFAHTARYDAAILNYLSNDAGVEVPDRVEISLERVAGLRYGENPHQDAVLYHRTHEAPWGGFVQLQGKELSYNNIVDLDAAYRLAFDFDEPAAVIVKHTNPAGCAVHSDPAEAFRLAHACDPKSAFGGIIVLNREVPEAVGEAIADTFFELVAAPGFSTEALEHLGKKRNLRLLTAPSLPPARVQYRPTVAGWLAQTEDRPRPIDRKLAEIATRRGPTDDEWKALEFAWSVCRHVKSNAIVLARGQATIGVGAGQMSRVDAVELAVKKAGTADRSVLASDAFFPFRDGPDAAAAAGVTAIIQPGGSIRDEEVVAACDEHDIAMVFTRTRHFKH